MQMSLEILTCKLNPKINGKFSMLGLNFSKVFKGISCNSFLNFWKIQSVWKYIWMERKERGLGKRF